MRILAVTSSYPKFAGDTTAPFIEAITKALAARGHQVTMVLPACKGLDPVAIDGVRFSPYRYAPWEALEVFGYAAGLREDVAIRHSAYLVSPLAMLSGASRLWSHARAESFDLLHAHWVVPNGAMALPAVRWASLPLVVSLHGSDVFVSEKGGVVGRAASMAFARAGAATACSTDLATRSLALGASKKPEVIPYGVDADFFRPHLERDGASAPTVFAVGRLVRKKGFEVLVDAAGLLAQQRVSFRLVIGGKGDLEGELRERAAERGVSDRFELVGDVGREELARRFASATVVAVPSVRDDAGNVDGLPNVLLEAMASGAPIVASDVAGIPEAVRADRDGLLVPEKDPAALAASIRKLLGSAELRDALGASARTRATDAFSWSRVGEHFENVFRSVTEARG